jgi:hypothetical protein
MKSIYFVTPTLLSHLDLFSMGGSEKASNDNLIGKYNSGLCYSMALALRNSVDMSVNVYDSEYFNESDDRQRDTLYTIGTYTEVCEQTDKEKELIKITKSVSKQSFFSAHCDDYGGGDFDPEEYPTGYSTQLGIDWSLYMLMRELYSNMLDEGGQYYDGVRPVITYGTIFTLRFEEDSEFAEIWNNRHLYINEDEPLYKLSDDVEILKNTEGYLRVYKQNILVYQDTKKPSRFAFNIKNASIDERRILSNLYGVEGNICDAIMSTENEEFLRLIITPDFKSKEGEFLGTRGSYYNASELLHTIACEVSEEFGTVSSYSWLIDAIKKRKDCRIAGKKIANIGDHIWSYSDTVTVESSPKPFAEPSIEVEGEIFIDPFLAEIKKHYDFELDVEVRKAKLKGSKVIADKFQKCLIIDENFNIEEDFGEFIIQYLDLTQTGNIVKNLSDYICKLIKIK